MQPRDILLNVLYGRIPLSAASVGLTDGCRQVAISPLDIAPMLKRYLADEIDANDLQEWASWVLSRPEYYVELDNKSDAAEDYYEPMWHVLQQLSTPFIDGAISRDGVIRHLETLFLL